MIVEVQRMSVPKCSRCNQIALGSSYSGINSLPSALATHLETFDIIHWDLFINLMGDIWLIPPLTFVVAVQLLSSVWTFVTSWIAALQTSLSFIISWSLLKLMSIESMIPSNHLILCYPLLLPSNFLQHEDIAISWKRALIQPCWCLVSDVLALAL